MSDTHPASSGLPQSLPGSLPQELLFGAAFEQSAIAKLLRRPDGQIVYANPAFCALLGYQPQEMAQGQGLNLLPPEDILREQPLLASVQAGRQDHYRLAQRFVHAEGRTLVTTVAVTALCDENGALICLMSEIEDHSELESGRLSLELSQAWLSDALELAKAGEWELDFASGALSWSKEMFSLLGHEHAAFEPDCQKALKLLVAQDRQRLIEQYQSARKTDQGFELELSLEQAVSRTRHLHIQAGIRIDKKGESTGLLGLCLDQTEARQLSEQLLEASENLSKLNAHLSQLAELVDSTLDKTLSELSLLSNKPASPMVLLDSVVNHEIDRLDAVSDELEASRSMSGQRRSVSLTASLKRAERMLEGRIESQSARIETDFAAWDQIDYVPACFDQIILYLLEQALGSGESWPEIRFRSLFAEGQPGFEVERVLTNTAQAPDEQPGAALTRLLLEACGGRMAENFTPGQGHTLTVWF